MVEAIGAPLPFEISMTERLKIGFFLALMDIQSISDNILVVSFFKDGTSFVESDYNHLLSTRS